MAFNWVKFPWTNLHDLNLDWIIQTVKTLEDNLTDAIGQFTEIANSLISPEREARLAGDAALQTEIENGVYPTISRNINDVNTSINTERTERIAGDATLQTTIDDVIMPILNSTRENVNTVDSKLNSEIGSRTSGDAALQSTIDDVIMPRLDSLSASNNSYVLLVTGTASTDSSIPLTARQVTDLQAAAQNNQPITLILKDGDHYTAYYPIVIESTSMVFGMVNNFNSFSGDVDVNQALGSMVVAQVNIQNSAGTLDFIKFNSGLTRFLPLSLSIIWPEDTNSYTLTDNEYAILRQSLLDKRQIFIVRNTGDTGGEQTTYMLQTCATPSILNVDSMTLVLQGPSNKSIKVQMASKTIVPNVQ